MRLDVVALLRVESVVHVAVDVVFGDMVCRAADDLIQQVDGLTGGAVRDTMPTRLAAFEMIRKRHQFAGG